MPLPSNQSSHCTGETAVVLFAKKNKSKLLHDDDDEAGYRLSEFRRTDQPQVGALLWQLQQRRDVISDSAAI